MKKQIIVGVFSALLLCISLFSGCSQGMYLKDNSATGYENIQAVPNATKSAGVEVPLYFQFESEAYLSSQVCQIQYNSAQRKEYGIVQALINGPTDSELTPLINSATKILSITVNNDYIYVSLSNDFLQVPASMTPDWESDSATAAKVFLQRRLAVYSIVNTLTEEGQFARVQIYVDINSDINADKISRRQAGLIGDGNEDQPLEALARNTGYILNPENTANLALELIAKNQLDRLYTLVNDDLYTNTSKPTLENFSASFNASKLTMTDYTVLSASSLSNAGTCAVVMVSYTTKSGANTTEHNNVPLVLFRTGERYGVSFGFIERYLQG